MTDLLKLFDEAYASRKKQDEEIDGTPYIDKALKYFKELDCSELFEKNITTLTIKKPARFSFERDNLLLADGSYNPNNNTITAYNKTIIFHELAHVASYKDENNEGVLIPGKDFGYLVGKSFNEGFCDYIASQLDSNYLSRYPLEKLVVEKIIEKFGDEPLKYFLQADYNSFHNFIKNNQLNGLLTNLDNYTNLYNIVKEPDCEMEDLEMFYESYSTIFENNLLNICSEEEIDSLEESFLSTLIGAETSEINQRYEKTLFQNQKQNTI